ncbi:tol-pal system protein YbgF [Pseudoxanthobacter sp. M-2]|uniref:tol-pal system protein YbgF n=1 Tax=Pseudoxanthobacter sp. M-2 TaxID=3078754 RepID=UPI0038FBF28F
MTMRMLGAERRYAGAGFGAAVAASVLMVVATPATAQQSWDTAQIIRDTPTNTRQAGEAALRIERIEGQMRALNGQVEELTFQIRQLTDQIRRMQEDNEFRFQELEAGRGKKRTDAPAAAPATGGTDTATLTIPPADAAPGAGSFDGGTLDGAAVGGSALDVGSGFAMEPLSPSDALPGVAAGSSAVTAAPPQSLGQLPLDGAGGFDFSSGPLDLTAMSGGGAPVAGTPSAALPPLDTASDATYPPAAGTQVAALPTALDPRDAYDAAYNHVMRGEYDAAEAGFRRFLDAHPSDRLAPDAQFWLGESLYARADYRAAAQAFLKGYTEYPDSRKGPDSLFKLGQSLAGIGEKDAACASYAELLQRYPQASSSLRDRVSAEQQTARC